MWPIYTMKGINCYLDVYFTLNESALTPKAELARASRLNFPKTDLSSNSSPLSASLVNSSTRSLDQSS